MSMTRIITSFCAVATLALGAACRRQAPVSASTPVEATETSCWWTVYRSPLPVDTVAEHLVNAFTALGLTSATHVQHGDTAWADAGPTRIATRFGGTFSARAVALQRGDSTFYRYFVTAAPPPGGWPKGRDSVTVNNTHISVNPASSGLGLCAAIASRAQNGGKAPKEPNGEETWALWSSRPSAGASDPTGASTAQAPATATATVESIPIVLRSIEPAKADSIVLERTPCFGTCPPYRLRIAKSGEIVFRSRAARDTTDSRGSVTPEDAHRVFAAADRLAFDALPDTIARSSAYCHSYVTDYPTAITTVYVGSASKQVVDYFGCDWAPVGLRDLEELVDRVAGTVRFLAPKAAR